MACNKQRGTAPFCRMIHETSGWAITQAEWHELRQIAKEQGNVTSRQHADRDRLEDGIARLTHSLATELVESGLSVDDAAKQACIAADDARIALRGATVTRGTLGIVNLIANHTTSALKETVASRIKKRRSGRSSASPTPNETVEKFEALRRREIIALRQESEAVADSTRNLMEHVDPEDREPLIRILSRLTPAVNAVHEEYAGARLARETRPALGSVYGELYAAASRSLGNYGNSDPARFQIEDYLTGLTRVVDSFDGRGSGLTDLLSDRA